MKSSLPFLIFFCLIQVSLKAQTRIVPQTGHHGWFEMAISPDGKRMVTAGVDGKIIHWDLNKFKASWHHYGHKAPITDLEWRYDNRYFLTASLDSTIEIWDTETMKSIITYHHFSTITAASFNPKTNVLAYADAEGRILLYDLLKNEEFLRIEAKSRVNALQWSDNGFILFAGTEEKGVMAYEMDKGSKVLDMPYKNSVMGLQLTPENKLLLIYLSDGSTELFQPSTSKAIGSIPMPVVTNKFGYQSFLWQVASQNSEYLFSAESDHTIHITKLSSMMKNIYNSAGINSDIVNIAQSPMNNFFAATDGAGGIWICYFSSKDWLNGAQLYWKKLLFETERIHHIDFLNNDQSLAMKGNNLYEINLINGDLTRREDDSSSIHNTSYSVRYFSMDKMKNGIYFCLDLTKNTLTKIKDNSYSKNIPQFATSIDTNVIAIVDDKQLIIYDIDLKSIVKKETITNENFILFNGNLNNNFITLDKNTLRFIDCKTRTEKNINDAPASGITWLTTDKLMKTIYGIDGEGKVLSWDYASSKRNINKGDLKNIRSKMFEVSTDGSKMILVTNDNKLKQINLQTGLITATINGNFPTIYHVAINDKGSQVAFADADGVVHLYDMELKNNLVNIITSPRNGLIAYTGDNYYIATKEAAQNIALVENNTITSFDKVDLKLNRPDMVLKSIGLSDPDLIAAYDRAYQKRIKNSGYIISNDNSIPTIEILNFSSLQTTTEKNQLELKLKANSNDLISSIKIWVNGVPINGKNGFKQATEKKEVIVNYTVPLLFGGNKIEVASVSNKGIESEKSEFQIVNKKPSTPQLYLVSIGVSKYQDTRYNLTYADKDAKDLAEAFSTSKVFSKVNKLVFTNEEVRREKISEIKSFLSKSRPEDVVIVFVAGHGLRDNNLDYFFATHDIDFNDPAKKGISDLELEGMLDGIASLRKLLFFDTCLSGEMDKEDVEQAVAATSQKEDITFRNVGTGLRTKKPIGFQNAQFLMKEIFNDVRRGTGASVMSSAGGAEYAMESSTWKNGLFTYCILKGLKEKAADANKDNEIDLDELQVYVRKEVTLLSKGKQYPDYKSANLELNFRIW